MSRSSSVARCRLAGLSAALLASTVAAQTQGSAPLRFVPAEAAIVARIAAPARMSSRFATTQIAKLAQASTLEPLFAAVRKSIDAGIAELRSSSLDTELLERMLDDYRGELICGFVAPTSFADRPRATAGEESFAVVLALTPDGSYDFGPLVAELERAIEREGVPLRDLTIGDHRLRITIDQQPGVALPAIIDGHLVMLIGGDLETGAARILAEDQRFRAGPDAAPLWLHVEIGKLLGPVLREIDLEGAPVDMGEVMRLLGLESLQSATCSLDADGRHVVASLRVDVSAQGRGLLGALLPTAGQPRLLGCVPPTSRAFSIGAFDTKALATGIGRLWSLLEDMVPLSWDDAMEAFTTATKVRLMEDLIEHVGAELLTVADEDDLHNTDLDAVEADELAMFTGSAYGLALRDGRAFGTALERALRSRGLHAGRKTSDYAGVQLHSLRIAGLVQLEYAVTEELLLVAVGDNEGSRRAIRSVLDARASGEATVPEAIRARITAMPAGYNGIAAIPIDVSIRMLSMALSTTGSEWFSAGSRDPGLDLSTVFGALEGLAGELKRLGIDTIAQASYGDPRGATWQLRW